MSLTPESRRTLADRLDTTAEAWKPEPGDKIVGEVIDVDSRETEWGVYPIVTVRTSDGDEFAIHGFHTVLKREFSKVRPDIGDRVGVKYLGRHERGYEAYRVVRDEAPKAVDWDAMGVEAETEFPTADEPADEIPRFPAPDADDDIPF